MANTIKRGNVGTTPFGDYLTMRGAVSTAQTFYPNAMIGLTAAGYADKMDDAALKVFDGVLTSSNAEVLSGGSNGDVLLAVNRPRFITVAIAAAAVGDVTKPVYAVDDQTVALTPGSYGNRVGTVHQVLSATCVVVECEYPCKASTQVISGDGAVTIKEGTVFLTKASAAAITLAAPTATADDGKRLLVVSTTAQAHTLTQTTPGINSGGTGSDVGTFGTAIGNSIELVAYQGVWYTVGTPRGVTLA